MNLKTIAGTMLAAALFTGCESEQAEKDNDAKLAAQAKIPPSNRPGHRARPGSRRHGQGK